MKKTIQTTLTMEMQPKSKPKNYLTLTSWLEDSHVKHFLLQEREEGLMTQEEHSFLKSQGFSKTIKPPYFLLENVRGLLSHDKGRTFQTILGVLSDLGYIVQWTLLNSADFQVPQRRERVFIEGYLGGGSTGEVLSVRRNCSKNITKVNSFRDKHRTFSVYPDTNTITGTLTAEGQNGGGNQVIFEPPSRQ